MTTERGFLAELFHRRVPQILGLYIGGVWLCIEIGNWLGEQFTMPDRLTAYLFVFLVMLVPSVALIAWVHGAPGKDKTTRLERIFVPANVLVAVAALTAVPSTPPMGTPAVAAVSVDQDFVEQPQARSVRVLAFSLRNETADAPDWYSYAFPYLLSEDMIRASTAFQVFSAIESTSATELLRRRGFDRAMGEPSSVQTEIARKSGHRYLIRGSVRDVTDSERLEVTYELVRVDNGVVALSGSAQFDTDDPFTAADSISVEIQQYLVDDLGGVDAIDRLDLALAESLTPSADALQYFVNAIVALNVDTESSQLQPLLDQALEADPLFAEARATRARSNYYQGDTAAAIADIEETLRTDYRLSKASRFQLLINKAMIEQDPNRAIDVARTWVSTQRNDERAHRRLAAVLEMNSVDLDQAIESYEQVRRINPNAIDTLLEMASIERQRGNLDAAVGYIETYLEEDPESFSARLQLARTRLDQGQFDASLAEFERAGYLDNQSIAPQLGVIQAQMRKGSFAQAEDRLSRLKQRALTDAQRLEAATTAMWLFQLQGQYGQALAELAEVDEIAQRIMNPLSYSLQMKAPMISMRSYIDDDVDSVIAQMDALRAEAQPPWNTFMYWYDLTPYTLYNEGERYHEAMVQAAGFFRETGNVNMQMMLLTAEAQDALFMNEPERVVETAEEALSLTSESLLNVLAATEIANLRATMYDLISRAGEPARAIEGLLPVVAQFPGHAMAHLRLAQAYFALGETQKSRASLERALDIWQDADATFVYLKEAQALKEQLETDA